MSTLTPTCSKVKPSSKPRKKAERRLRLAVRPQDGSEGVLIVKEGTFGGGQLVKGSEDTYLLQPIPADFGRAFSVTKTIRWVLLDGAATLDHDARRESYHVNLNGRESTCECKGFLRHGHCRHLEALTTLADHGRL
jgi:SWIM zinc finger